MECVDKVESMVDKFRDSRVDFPEEVQFSLESTESKLLIFRPFGHQLRGMSFPPPGRLETCWSPKTPFSAENFVVLVGLLLIRPRARFS